MAQAKFIFFYFELDALLKYAEITVRDEFYEAAQVK
jgi:hypothetical protein